MLGLDAALGRAADAVSLGVDGVFVEAPHDEAELARIGSHPALQDVPLLANMLEGGESSPPIIASDRGLMSRPEITA